MPASADARRKAIAPVVDGRMPTSRAPTRLTAVARSALPVSVRSKNEEEQEAEERRAGDDQNALAGNVDRSEVEERPRHRLGAEALRPEKQQREAGYREVHRHRDDQQDQDRGVGERPKRDAVEQRRDRQHDREGQRDAEPHRKVAPGGQPDQQPPGRRAAPRTADSAFGRRCRSARGAPAP